MFFSHAVLSIEAQSSNTGMQVGELVLDMPSQTPSTGAGSDMGGCRLTIFRCTKYSSKKSICRRPLLIPHPALQYLNGEPSVASPF